MSQWIIDLNKWWHELGGYERAYLIITAAGVVAAVCVLWIYYKQLRTMQKQLTATERPWVYVTVEAIGPLMFDKEGAMLPLLFSIKNVGHSPADRVAIHFRGVVDGVGDKPRVVQGRLCAAARAKAVPLGAITIFPDQEPFEQPVAIQFSKSDIDGFREKGRMLPVIVGCIDYRFASGTDHHQTGFMYQVLSNNFSQTDYRPIPTDQGNVKAADFTISPYIYDSLGTGYFFAN